MTRRQHFTDRACQLLAEVFVPVAIVLIDRSHTAWGRLADDAPRLDGKR